MENKKVTIYDVAKKLGVSTATVNRALNGKPKVSDNMRMRVIETAEEMGYKASKTASSLSRKQIKIGMIICDSISGFIHEVERGVRKALNDLQDYRVSGEIKIINNVADKKEYEDAFLEMIEKGFDGIGVVPLASETEFDELIERGRDKGIVIGTAVSDLPTSKRSLSVRNNGKIAGKMAAELLYWLVGNEPIALVTGFRDSTVHKETIEGFKAFADKHSMNFAGIFEHRDDSELAYYLASRMMKERPDIKGIYFGSANSVTFCNRLIELGYEKKIKIVASDLLPGIVEFLKQGMINATIFQNPFGQGRLLINHIYRMIAENYKLENDVYYLNPQIVLASNLEEFV